ncbi:S41 family peptidase [Hathewaya limosa]|uniref:Carboxyl-terminal processing protease n=1 Tax=Hathewaya limosa TaxID=1536 RepID=A0ABU0JW91_HATLI|nr:S41 family peptidase [Hathewaya limosa]MDQ0480730.1 carboxyl-terminal processing protease [Hathewaya limosa]
MSNEEINNNEKNMDDNEKNKFTEQSNNKNIEPEVEQNKDIKVSQENVDKRPKRSKKGVALIIALLVATNTATAYIAPRVYSKVVTKVPFSDIEYFKKLFAVKGDIDRYYVNGYKKDKLVDGAIKGMTSAIGDPYTTYFDKKEYEKWNTETGGKYVGVGIQIGVTMDNKVVIISPFEKSPADKAGILPGDILLKVNDLNVTPQTLDKAIAKMKGKEGEKVHLTLERKDKGKFDVELVTAEIKMITVKSEVIDNNIGYMRMSMFDENTGDSFIAELKNLKDKNIKGLILDLRGNPGGLVTQCIKITSNFIPKGETIVYTEDKNKNKEEYKSIGGLAQDLPLVILVDEGTASASEILSAAVRDHKKGTLIGTKTFGKGKVQTILDKGIFGLGDGTALKVTISYYFTPKGENIDKKGIQPDVKVEYPEELKQKPYNRNTDPQFKKALEVIKGKIK